MRVNEVMSGPVHTIVPSATANDAWARMRLYRTRHLVVVDGGGHVIGVLSAGDLGGRKGESLRNGRRVSDVMTAKVVVAAPSTTVREAANMMRGRLVSCLPVVAGGKLKGIVTALDLLELIGRGAERPVAKTNRRTLKNRGIRPSRRPSISTIPSRAD